MIQHRSCISRPLNILTRTRVLSTKLDSLLHLEERITQPTISSTTTPTAASSILQFVPQGNQMSTWLKSAKTGITTESSQDTQMPKTLVFHSSSLSSVPALAQMSAQERLLRSQMSAIMFLLVGHTGSSKSTKTSQQLAQDLKDSTTKMELFKTRRSKLFQEPIFKQLKVQ